MENFWDTDGGKKSESRHIEEDKRTSLTLIVHPSPKVAQLNDKRDLLGL